MLICVSATKHIAYITVTNEKRKRFFKIFLKKILLLNYYNFNYEKGDFMQNQTIELLDFLKLLAITNNINDTSMAFLNECLFKEEKKTLKQVAEEMFQRNSNVYLLNKKKPYSRKNKLKFIVEIDSNVLSQAANDNDLTVISAHISELIIEKYKAA